MKTGYYLLTVSPLSPETEKLALQIFKRAGRRPIKVIDDYTIYTEFNKKKKARKTLLISNKPLGRSYMLMSNSTFVTRAYDFTKQHIYFSIHKKEIERAMEDSETGKERGWKTTYVANYSDGELLNVIPIYYKGTLKLSRDDLRAIMELYFETALSGVVIHREIQGKLREHERPGMYLIDAHVEESLYGFTKTTYALLLER